MKRFSILFLSLFFISCGADGIIGGSGGYGGKHSKSEIIGTWTNCSPSMPRDLSIGLDGTLITYYDVFNHNDYGFKATIYGKINDTFDYPYTVNLTCSNNNNGQISSGTVIFTSSSSCSMNIYIPGIYDPNIKNIYAKQ